MSTSTKRHLSIGWGFAEATLFFILPDVLLSYFALDRKTKLLPLIVWALIGAIAGGSVMYYWGSTFPKTSWHWVEAVPAINYELMVGVKEQLNQHGIASVILGPLQGLPYKTFAVQAPSAGIGIVAFISASVVARLIRFMLIAYLARGLIVLLMEYMSITTKTTKFIWLSVWVTVYLLYFAHFPS